MTTRFARLAAVLCVVLSVIALGPVAAEDSLTVQKPEEAPGAAVERLAEACGLRAAVAPDLLDVLLTLRPAPAPQSTADSPFGARQGALGQPPFRLACSGDPCGCTADRLECGNECWVGCGGFIGPCLQHCIAYCNEANWACSCNCCGDCGPT